MKIRDTIMKNKGNLFSDILINTMLLSMVCISLSKGSGAVESKIFIEEYIYFFNLFKMVIFLHLYVKREFWSSNEFLLCTVEVQHVAKPQQNQCFAGYCNISKTCLHKGNISLLLLR